MKFLRKLLCKLGVHKWVFNPNKGIFKAITINKVDTGILLSEDSAEVMCEGVVFECSVCRKERKCGA